MMSNLDEQQHQEMLLELARDLCAVIERGDLTGEEALEALAGLRALMTFLKIAPRNRRIRGSRGLLGPQCRSSAPPVHSSDP